MMVCSNSKLQGAEREVFYILCPEFVTSALLRSNACAVMDQPCGYTVQSLDLLQYFMTMMTRRPECTAAACIHMDTVGAVSSFHVGSCMLPTETSYQDTTHW